MVQNKRSSQFGIFGRFLGAVALLWLVSACTKNSPPKITELIKINAPVFDNGNSSISLSTASREYTIIGKCDPGGYGLQFSYDGTNYQDVEPGCVNGKFSINVLVIKLTKVFIRAKSKTSFTGDAVASIRLVLPPNSPLIGLNQGSTSPDSGSSDPVMQSTTSSTMTGIPTYNGSVNLDTEITGVAYDRE